MKVRSRIVLWLTSWICLIKQAFANKETGRFYRYYKEAAVFEVGWTIEPEFNMFWYNKTLVEFDLVQHQISFAGSSDVRLSFALPCFTYPGKKNIDVVLGLIQQAINAVNIPSVIKHSPRGGSQ